MTMSIELPTKLGLSPNAIWSRHLRPFVHFRAEGVFDSPTYQRLVHEFRKRLEDTRKGQIDEMSFKPPTPKYDAWVLALNNQSVGLFSPLFEAPWLSYLASLFGLSDTRLLDGALHHIPRGSRSGYIHTDFCSAWFDRYNEDETPRFPVRRLTEYFSGRPKGPDASPVEYIRAGTMIFYLANDGWINGDGGETALFSCLSGRGPISLCEPKNNSLLLFECMPHSFHALRANPGRERNSVILWFHSDIDRARGRWGVGMNRREQ